MDTVPYTSGSWKKNNDWWNWMVTEKTMLAKNYRTSVDENTSIHTLSLYTEYSLK